LGRSVTAATLDDLGKGRHFGRNCEPLSEDRSRAFGKSSQLRIFAQRAGSSARRTSLFSLDLLLARQGGVTQTRNRANQLPCPGPGTLHVSVHDARNRARELKPRGARGAFRLDRR